ncbi:pentapeptide repeat-containing protein [Kribbella caucasensis]|uniref:pentapeptide repeat-containing protein n=1 Tax=Kribbella caucasensis TaxID=2512215 RepID=UPI001EDFFFC7|nr:pentapeptide repeat-containing protein [Kribbella sp. VKM Ac-2527]
MRTEGFQGCTVYDCFGAGQKISQQAGTSWRDQSGQEMFAALPIMRQLHELLWYLADALDRTETKSIRPELTKAQQRIEALTQWPVLDVDLGNERQSVNQLLLRTSELVRGNPGKKKQRRGADLMGAVLRGADLSRADLRGCYLIGADLTGADLRKADCIGADFRDTDLGDADLTGALFLTQSQANAARGNDGTKLPGTLIRPPHWG